MLVLRDHTLPRRRLDPFICCVSLPGSIVALRGNLIALVGAVVASVRVQIPGSRRLVPPTGRLVTLGSNLVASAGGFVSSASGLVTVPGAVITFVSGLVALVPYLVTLVSRPVALLCGSDAPPDGFVAVPIAAGVLEHFGPTKVRLATQLGATDALLGSTDAPTGSLILWCGCPPFVILSFGTFRRGHASTVRRVARRELTWTSRTWSGATGSTGSSPRTRIRTGGARRGTFGTTDQTHRRTGCECRGASRPRKEDHALNAQRTASRDHGRERCR